MYKYDKKSFKKLNKNKHMENFMQSAPSSTSSSASPSFLPSEEFNPAHLCYQTADLPEARGYACISFATPLRGSERNSVIAHTTFYLQATETLLLKLFTPLSPAEVARIGQHFLNNATMANEVQDALLKDLISKIQQAETNLREWMQDPAGALIIHTPPATPPRQPRLTQMTSHTAQLTLSAFTFLADKVCERVHDHFYPSPPRPHAPPSSPNDPVVPAPLTAADYSATVRSYEQHVIRPLQQLFRTLDDQTKTLRDELDLLAAPAADGLQSPSNNPSVQEAKRQYEITLRRMRNISSTMHDHFKELTLAQDAQWNRVLNTIRSTSPARNDARNDHVESDIKTGEPITLPVLLNGRQHDPRMELLFLQRLREHNLHVVNVPGNGHCGLYSVFKDPQVLPTLRPLLYSLPNAAPVAGASPLNPTETLEKEVMLTRQLIADKLKEIYATTYEHASADDQLNLAMIKACEVEECVEAKAGYRALYGKAYQNSPEEYQKLENCYWTAFVNGSITLSSDHLSALSTILERPILVYSLHYLSAPFVQYHLLQNTPADTPLPPTVTPFQDCYQRIPVQPEYMHRLDEQRPIYIYQSHGHYQAMSQSRY